MKKISGKLPDRGAVDTFDGLSVEGVGGVGRDGQSAVVGAVADGAELVMVVKVGAHVGVALDRAGRAEVPVLHQNHPRTADPERGCRADGRTGEGTASNCFLGTHLSSSG